MRMDQLSTFLNKGSGSRDITLQQWAGELVFSAQQHNKIVAFSLTNQSSHSTVPIHSVFCYFSFLKSDFSKLPMWLFISIHEYERSKSYLDREICFTDYQFRWPTEGQTVQYRYPVIQSDITLVYEKCDSARPFCLTCKLSHVQLLKTNHKTKAINLQTTAAEKCSCHNNLTISAVEEFSFLIMH